jgi:hypothetical protein
MENTHNMEHRETSLVGEAFRPAAAMFMVIERTWENELPTHGRKRKDMVLFKGRVLLQNKVYDITTPQFSPELGVPLNIKDHACRSAHKEVGLISNISRVLS